MEEYMAFDSHKHYTWVEHEAVQSGRLRRYRLELGPGPIHSALARSKAGTAVAFEATANWDWTAMKKASYRVVGWRWSVS